MNLTEYKITHLPKPHGKNAFAWGITEERQGKKELLACMETCPERQYDLLRITKLWVHEKLRRNETEHDLLEIAKEQTFLERRKAVILEVKSDDPESIHFYEQEGFKQINLNNECYLKNGFLTLGYILKKNPRLPESAIEIRPEKKSEYHKTEEVALRAFWNKHYPGCNEHLLIHKMRSDTAYLPQLSRVAVVEGEIAGAIFYVKAALQNGEKTKEILTFGPLCIAPKWQGCGIGAALLNETLKLAKSAGYEGVVIFGEPDYYPLHGFKPCEHFGITTMDGRNFAAFMGIELAERGLSDFGGKFCEPHIFEDLPEEENEAFTKQFQIHGKQRFPSQWD